MKNEAIYNCQLKATCTYLHSKDKGFFTRDWTILLASAIFSQDLFPIFHLSYNFTTNVSLQGTSTSYLKNKFIN